MSGPLEIEDKNIAADALDAAKEFNYGTIYLAKMYMWTDRQNIESAKTYQKLSKEAFRKARNILRILRDRASREPINAKLATDSDRMIIDTAYSDIKEKYNIEAISQYDLVELAIDEISEFVLNINELELVGDIDEMKRKGRSTASAKLKLDRAALLVSAISALAKRPRTTSAPRF